MKMKSLSKSDLPLIEVKEEDDGSFTFTWDDTDPRLEHINSWTEEDWIEAIETGLTKLDHLM